ncbi:hypothetical protein BCR43DRAFT_507742 [Syncephalastrum racemosum]|uniref:Transcription factor domain-containing protein n=1 Tax=Syncephalastrum racemosum TaxID=13706 RepID=A0A1X2H4L2_SYNRA|nr:hypothetical protein BCR43DRAFT_507742 [Syncephalastrum racemosum]
MGQPFIDRPMRTPSYFCQPWDLPVMLKTHGMMAIHFKDFIFKQASRCTNRLTAAPPRFIPPPPGDDLYHQTIQAAKLSLIRLYFDCGHSLHPALVRSHYEPYLLAHPDCMVANALAALKAIGTCYHNARLDLPMPFSQTALEALSSCRINDARDLPNEFAEQHYAKARMQLEDVLFDEDPDLDTLITLWLLSCYSLSTSRYKQGRTYVALSWRVALQLQDRYLPHSPQKSGEGAEAETWKRLYYCIRNMQYSLEDALESSQNFRPVVLPSPIGLPTALPCEQNIPELHHAVNVFSHCVRLSVLPGGPHKTDKRETIEKYLEALSQTRVSSTDIKAIEDQLIEFWTCLPPEFRLTDTPMGFMDSGRLERQEPTAPVLHLNLMYYLGWLMLEARLMDDPSLVDLSHISLHGPIDGARALLVLAMSSDALSKIIHELHRKARCHFTAHWAALVIIMLKAVAHCSHKGIRTMAEQNTALLLQTLVDYPSIRKAFLV